MPIYIPPALAQQAAREVGAWHLAQERRDVAAQALALADAELAKRTTSMREMARAIALVAVYVAPAPAPAPAPAAGASTSPRPWPGVSTVARPRPGDSTASTAPAKLPPPGLTVAPPGPLVPVPEGTLRDAGDEVAAIMQAQAAEYAAAAAAGEV